MSPRSIVLLIVLTAAALGSWYLSRANRATEIDDLPYEMEHRGY